MTIDGAGIIYAIKLPRGYQRPFPEKGIWINGGDLMRDSYTRVDRVPLARK